MTNFTPPSPTSDSKAPLETRALSSASSIRAADELKDQGNDYFRSSQWNEALAAYRSALGHLPKRREVESHDSRPIEEVQPTKDTPVVEERPVSESDQALKLDEFAKRRAVLNSNIGACYVKLADHQQAVDACSQALLDDPDYVKALQRRATSNDILASWSSLTAAQEDYIALIKLLPPSSSQSRDAERSLNLLKPRLELAQKRETSEMLDKLKGLGNSILGNFGLSTDNFKFEPNGQGGYSMNFQR